MAAEVVRTFSVIQTRLFDILKNTNIDNIKQNTTNQLVIARTEEAGPIR